MSGVHLNKSPFAVILASLLVLSIIPLVNIASGQGSTFDFGDAPDGGATGYVAPFAQTGSFPSLLASDGARVQSTADATLGPTASMEADALVVNADADDGLSELVILTVSIPPPAKLSVTVNGQPGGAGGTFYVNVLIDLNLDGEWAGATVNGQPEWVVQNFPTTVTPGDSNVVPLPEFAFSNGNALPAGAWMRIALTKEQVTANWDGSGEFSSGEIEDHVISLPVVGGKTPAMPVIENCQPNPALFPPGGVMTMFTCDIYSPQPGFAIVTFNCTPDTVAIIDFGNIGPPYPVGPAAVTLNYIAFKGASPPPRVNCNVVASSQDPPSVVTSTGVTIGFADSMTTVEFDTAEEQALEQTYAAIMSYARLAIDTDTVGAYDQQAVLPGPNLSGPIGVIFDVAHTQSTPLDGMFFTQVALDQAVIATMTQEVSIQPGENFGLAVEWMPPGPGEYIISTFLWDSLDHPTTAYSPAMYSEISLLPTRSAEWWADRPYLAAQVWENVVAKSQHPQCGDFVIDDAQKLMGGLLADPAETTEGTSRGTMEARMEMAKESLADALNHETFGSKRSQPGCFEYGMTFSGSTSVENTFIVEGINSVLLQNTDSQILDRATEEFLDRYFQGQEYSTEPDPELAQELANLSYWDLFAEEPAEEQPEVEESLTPTEPDSSEITFAHRVGDTDCPQYIGSIFLEDAGVEGEWIISGQPEWLDIDLDDNFVEFYFNCFIEDTSSHTIEDEVEFEFFADDPEFEEIDQIEIAVIGEIIGEDP